MSTSAHESARRLELTARRAQSLGLGADFAQDILAVVTAFDAQQTRIGKLARLARAVHVRLFLAKELRVPFVPGPPLFIDQELAAALAALTPDDLNGAEAAGR